MTFLQRLKTEREARIQYEKDELRMKEILLKIQNYHMLYDAEFLNRLEAFMDAFAKSKLIK